MLQVGIDFGTTNSVIALLGADGTARSAVFGTDDVFRTVLCFWAEEGRAGHRLHHAAGPAAIAAYQKMGFAPAAVQMRKEIAPDLK